MVKKNLSKKYCPPNTFCFDSDNLFYILVLMLLTILFFLYKNKDFLLNIFDKPKIIEKNNENISKEIIINVTNDNDKKDLLEEPGRKYFSQRSVPINIRTRGEPDNYSQIGFITSESNPNEIKPLFGRQTYRGSSLWNYYTALDSHLSTKIPVQKNRNCIDTHGCSEINSGDTINISGSPENYKVELYPYNELKYIPYL